MQPGSPPTHVVPGVEDLVEIGRGAFGAVYRGRQTDLARDVAVKVLWSRGAPEADLQRWRREVTAMARLSNHPNIVAVYDGGTTAEGLPYLVMPFVPGGTLGARVREHGPMPVDEVVDIGTKLAGALASAHANGVLHRDVKPDNVLLSQYGEPQLTDFGIARLLDATATGGAVLATIPFAPPEILNGSPATEASDVYSLAATLFTCLAGVQPYPNEEGQSLIALATRVLTQPTPDLRDHGVPDVVAAVIADGMAKDPAARIPTATDFGRRLEAAGAALDEGTDAAPATTVAVPVTTPVVDAEPAWVQPPAATAPPATAAPAAAPRPRGPVPAARRSLPVGTVVAMVAVVLGVAAAVAFALGQDDADSGNPNAATDTTAPAAGGEPTTTAAPAPPSDLRQAGLAYFEAIGAGDLAGAYAMLTPEFQGAQTFESYEAFWGSFASVVITGELTVDENDRRVTVPLELDGRRESFTLSFVERDGGFLVDGPRPG